MNRPHRFRQASATHGQVVPPLGRLPGTENGTSSENVSAMGNRGRHRKPVPGGK
jgi:hypothetical protein